MFLFFQFFQFTDNVTRSNLFGSSEQRSFWCCYLQCRFCSEFAFTGKVKISTRSLGRCLRFPNICHSAKPAESAATRQHKNILSKTFHLPPSMAPSQKFSNGERASERPVSWRASQFCLNQSERSTLICASQSDCFALQILPLKLVLCEMAPFWKKNN